MSDEAKSDGPTIIVRHRESQGTIRHSRRIERYWKSKRTGVTVEVHRYMHVANEDRMVVVFFDPSVNHELSLDEPVFREQFELVGNLSSKF